MNRYVVWLLIVALMLAVVVEAWPGNGTDLKDVIVVIMSVAQFALVVDMRKGQAPGGYPELDLKEK